MAEKAVNIQAFRDALTPLIKHQEGINYDTTGMADTKIVSETDGNIPQTQAQEKIAKGRQFQKDYIVDPLTAIPALAWNAVAPEGWRAGRENWLINSKADIAQRRSELDQMKLYREKRDMTGNMIIDMAKAAKEKYTSTGDTKYLDMVVQAKNDMFAAQNLTDDDFFVPGDAVMALRDEAGLFTNMPNPYPVLEAGAQIGLGMKGMKIGDKLVQKHFIDNVAKGFKNSKGNFYKRAAGAVLAGAGGVALADYGYDATLDIMNRAGKAKAWMRDPQQQAGLFDSFLATVVPEAATFGDTGINRPKQVDRFKSALNAFVWDGAITGAFYGARPLYYGLRRVTGGVPFKMFKDKPSKAENIVGSKELLETELDLISKYAADKGIYKSPTEKLVFNVPFGETLQRIVNSKAFNWLGPADPVAKGSKNAWWPDPVEIPSTKLGRQMIGGQLGPSIAGTMAPAPLFGSGIRNNMANQGDFYILGVMQNMLGKFAPYANLSEMAIDWGNLSLKNARGFIAQAKALEKTFQESAEGMGKGFTDTNLVTIGKQTVKEYRDKLQTGLQSGNEGLIPQEYQNKVIKFIEKQILQPVAEGKTNSMRSLDQMLGLKEQMDDLLKPLKNDVLEGTTYADDITRLFKAWETDIASVSKAGYPEVARAFNDYDNFVSKGLLLWGTDVGKNVANIKKRGFDIVLDQSSTRAGHELFDVVVESAKKNPSKAYSELAALKNIVGERAYHNGVGSYIKNAFARSIQEVDGMLKFNGLDFRKSLGIGDEGSALKNLMEEALPGPKVTKLKIFDPKDGIFKDFDDELYATGVKEGLKDILGEEVPESFLKAETRQLPTIKEFGRLTTILDKLFENGIPRPAKFMMRRAIMGGTRSALNGIIPSRALGAGRVGGKEGAAIAAGTIGMGPLTMAGVAWLINYGGKVLTNPVSLRVFNNMMDANLGTTQRLANFTRIVRMYPEEWMAFDTDLAEMERRERIYRKSQIATNAATSTAGKMKDAIMENVVGPVIGTGQDLITDPAGTILEGIKKTTEVPGNPSILRKIVGDDPSFDMGSAGSSIMNNQTMNPSAAASLYEGNTDAALANQYGGGTQMAADGGLMELNPVMNNQGKFNTPQRGINDNPFQKEGIGSLV